MFRILDTIAFTVERIRQHMLLVFWVLLGITVAVTLALSLPLYVDAVYSGILQSELPTPPYAYRYRYLGAWNGNIGLDDMRAANAAVETRFVEELGLPVALSVNYVRGGTWQARHLERNVQYGTFGLSALDGSELVMQITDGTWPPPDALERVPLLLPETMLYSSGLQVGDELTLQRAGGSPIDAVVAALWRPTNPADPLWIFPPRFFDQVLLTERERLLDLIAEVETPIDEMGWYLVLDGSSVRTAEIDALLNSSERAVRDVERVLPGIRLTDSPNNGLAAFNEQVNALVRQLFIIVLPVGGLVLYFVSLVAGLLVTRQQPEDVKLRSRGMSRSHVLMIHMLMWGLIVTTALLLALLTAPAVVRLIGRTASFLDFTGISSVENVVITRQALLIAIVTGIAAASSGLLLAWRITRQNINSLKRVSVQSARAWWQRAYLDLLLIGLAAYVLWTLLQNDGIDASVDTPFADPLTFIAPMLFMLGLTLIFLRVLPVILSLLAGVIGVTSNIPILLALRELTRSIGRYRGTLLMTAFTLGLVGFTASMASTLDRSLLDVSRYRVGSELAIVTVPDAQTTGSQDEETGEVSEEVTGFNAPPVLELEALDAITHLSRVGRYDARLTIPGARLNGLALGVDRAGLGGVAFMRDDYSTMQLGAMLNAFAGNRTAVILNQQVADQYDIALGEEVRYEVQVLGEWQTAIRAQVVGFVDYFPTVDPTEQEFFLITSLQPIFEVAGTPLPFNVWLNVDDRLPLDDVKSAIRDTGFPVLRFRDPQTLLAEAQAEPARRGVLGFLSVGFAASILLTLIGSVIQSTASFQVQRPQLGSLRAMGLSGFSVQIYILTLQGLIALAGVGSGTLIGVGTTILFLPLFDFSGGLPPYLVRVAWDDIALVYGVFGAVLIAVALLLALVLSRQQLAQAVKLGNI